MFVLAHVSDLHMAGRPRLAELFGKRGLGFINWQRKRKYIHRPDVLAAITRDLASQPRDHVAVTGDLVNFSLADEYKRAAGWLTALGSPHEVSVVPGNHDTYVRGTEQAPAAFWADYMRGDDGIDRFPYVRRRGDRSAGAPAARPVQGTRPRRQRAFGAFCGGARPAPRPFPLRPAPPPAT